MNLIGVIGKVNLQDKYQYKTNNIIRISKNNILNIKNVKFTILIINDNLVQFKHSINELKYIIDNAKYIILNSDENVSIEITSSIKKKIITYGLNQKATVTVSSITSDNILVDLQREIENINGKIIEPEEKNILIENQKKVDINTILINYVISIVL